MMTEVETATLAPPTYTFDSRRLAAWTTTQEKSIAQDYPFIVNENETTEDYAARVYLQFLWLPDSIMPLHLLVPSLKRIANSSSATTFSQPLTSSPPTPSSSNPGPSTSPSSKPTPHPSHPLLTPLLLNPRAVTSKYHTQLPQVLVDGGAEGEMEETMMWFGLSHERVVDGASAATAAGMSHGEQEHSGDGPWTDDKWRQAYLERMERREVQIQILLHFYKLSLPGPPPPPKKRKSKRRSYKNRNRLSINPTEPDQEPDLTTQEMLESFMDRLSTWQLLASLDRTRFNDSKSMSTNTNGERKDDRDWMQIFAEDVVDKTFKNSLPELTALLHNKVFPEQLFPDSEEELVAEAPTTTSTNAPTNSNPDSKPTLSRTNSKSTLPTSTSASTRPTIERARSRSLSLSLAHEQQQRASYAPSNKKRVLNREVSMSRVFKPKPKPKGGGNLMRQGSVKTEGPKVAKGGEGERDVVLVQETPQKPRVSSRMTVGVGNVKNSIRPLFGTASIASMGGKMFVESSNPQAEDEDEDGDEWMMDSSPDIVLLSPTRATRKRGGSTSSGVGGMQSDEECEEGEREETPCRPSKVRRRR